MSAYAFRRGELYSFITGMASTAIARRLQKNFKQEGITITIEQWSVLYHLWKQDGISQQELCLATFRDKPSITRLLDNLEKLGMVVLTATANSLQEKTMRIAATTLNEALEGVAATDLESAKKVLQQVYDNLS
jgi:hypothetical protein